MNKVSSTANLAAVFAFLIGLLESGVIAGGLAWAFEDGLGGSRAGHLVALAVAGVASLAFALYAGRRAARFQAAQAARVTESDA